MCDQHAQADQDQDDPPDHFHPLAELLAQLIPD
jgi:hypothetical protein